MPRQHMDSLRPTKQPVELVYHADTSARKRRQRRTGYAQPRKRPQAEDETGVQYQVKYVRNPQQPHRNRRITRAAKDRIVEEEHDDGAASAQSHARIA